MTASARAVVPPTPTTRPVAETLTALPAAQLAKPLRTHGDLIFDRGRGAAWQAFAAAAGGAWQVAYDRATGVPRRIWGSGIAAPGVMGSPATAAQVARKLLADHLALVAPGASVRDFTLVSNTLLDNVRAVGFVQHAGGLRVVGGQVSFRFKHDRMIAIGSEALPSVTFTAAKTRLSRAAIATRATNELRAYLALPDALVTTATDEVVLPLVGDAAVLGYRLARAVTIDGGARGKYLAYADVATGAVLAVKQLNAYATATLLYRDVDRHPGNPRIDRPAVRAFVKVNGNAVTTSADGSIELDAPATITTGVTGDLVRVVNRFGVTTSMPEVPLAMEDLAMSPNASVVWDATADEHDDAQLSTFVNINIAKAFVSANIDPSLPLLAMQLRANVNITDAECNAFWDGEGVNFLEKSAKCQNTGLLQDVVFHEFGHGVHQNEVIEGVGVFDGAMSEGASDLLAAFITKDEGMGRGFFLDADGVSEDRALREIDRAGCAPTESCEAVWPRDVGEIHRTGLIYSGAMWDLRKALIEQYGELAGDRLIHQYYVGTLRRATDIPTALIEVLVEDDDDGNLDNGTPNECLIRAAFARHGLRSAAGKVNAPGALDRGAKSTLITFDLIGLSPRCTSDEISSVRVEWRGSGPATYSPPSGLAMATEVNRERYYVQLPLAIDGTIVYRAVVNFADGSLFSLPDNPADLNYQTYQGDTIPLYCTDFETEDPFATGWTTGLDAGAKNVWEWGTELGGATDPPAAYSGVKLLAMNLRGDYEATTTAYVQMPTIDAGRWSDVRLQYRRWLAVEDSYYDKATILLNDRQVWTNTSQDAGKSSSRHHIDREWRFHDLALSQFAHGSEYTVKWALASDEGLALGGWQIDDVCIVANVHSICGDGVKSPTEGCDLGAANADTSDSKCRTYCQLATCGDKIKDTAEECDHGIAGDNTCSATCKAIDLPTLGGCCSTSGGAGGSLALGTLVLGLLARRRRRT